MDNKKEYNIKTIEQLVDIATKDNIDNLMADLYLWLDYTVKLYGKFKEANPKEKDKLNSEIAGVDFIWIDDGKNELKESEFIDSSTGKLIRWVNYNEEKPKQNGLYFWMGKSNYGGYSFYDINHGFDFPDDVPTNKVDEQYLKWFKDE